MVLVARGHSLARPLSDARGILWAALALLVVRMMKAGRLETALAVGLLFSVVMNAQLLLPNAYMPEAVRMAHLAETASSNFLFGMFVGWLLSSPHAPDEGAARRGSIHRRDVDRAAIQ